MIGNVLGNRYRILREIGAGGMAKVYLAEDVKGNELIAVKVLYPQFGEDISFIQRFNREAKLASTLTDPHIVRVLDYGADRDLHYLVMEYVEGQDLHDTLQEQGPFEWKYALEVIDQLITALEHAHAHGVVHRDIKPQNMMLSENGLLKVLDFGIARIPTLPSLTQSGFIGSPYYASPEQAMGEEVDIRSDIYSSGIVLYELLSGNIPFDAKSPWSIISQHITSEPPPIELDSGEIPENVGELLNKTLAKRPEDRFQTPTALRKAIAAVLAGQAVPVDAGATRPLSIVDNSSLVESLTDRASQAIDTLEWMRAVDLLSQAAKLDPDNTDIAQKLAAVEAEARLASLYKSGQKAMDNGKWEEAINHFNVIIELEANYEETDKLLAEAHEALKQENTEQFVATRYKEGVADFEAKRWDSALEAFTEVQQLSPGYEDVENLLPETKKYANPNFVQKISKKLGVNSSADAIRWGLVAAGVIVIIFLSFLAFGNNNQASGDDDARERLKTLYEEAQLLLEQGKEDQAIAKLEEILGENPDYADAAQLRRELIATPTPTALPTATTVVVEATATPEINPLVEILQDAEKALEIDDWETTIDALTEIRKEDSEFETARVASLFCDAYVGRGLEVIVNITSEDDQQELVGLARDDFEMGVEECPKRTDLKDQAERASAYLVALETVEDDYETLIHTLTPIVAADPDYAGGNAKQALYNAYLSRAGERRESPETIAAALGDYEAALALNVDDPGEAQTQRAELLLSFSQQPVAVASAVEVTPTSTPEDSNEETPTPDANNENATPEVQPTPTSKAVRIKFGKPKLLSPEDDALFAGQFAEVLLEWEPVEGLEPDEYYDVTIMHLFADEPKYTGSTRTSETSLQITNDIGVGEAGGDRFYWWVTVRKDNTETEAGGLDSPVSLRSDAKSFVWSVE